MARMNPKVMELIKALEEALPEGEVVLVGSAKSEGLTEANKEWLASLIGVKPTATDKAHTIDLLDEVQEEIEDVIAKHRVALMGDDDDEDDEDEDICDECRLGECCGYCACCDDDEEDDDIEDEEDDEYSRGYADAMTEVQKTADEAYDFGKEDAEAELDEETMALVKLIKLMREMFGN